MKTNKLWSIMVMLTLMLGTAVSLSSCGGDDDDMDNDKKPVQGQNNGNSTGDDANTSGNAPATVEAIDLGLSVKWATCNVGATKPEGYGEYYAWGEIEPKEYYSMDTYKFYDKSGGTITKYNADSSIGVVDYNMILDSDDDVAHVAWGGSWRMPTNEEMQDLVDKCTWTPATVNGVKGYTVTGTNGNSIFLPASGRRSRNDLKDKDCFYWSSSLSRGKYAKMLSSGTSSPILSTDSREYGYTIRPVCAK